MTLQLQSGALLIKSGKLANSSDCCCPVCCDDQESIDIDLTIGWVGSGAGGCCSAAATRFNGSHNLANAISCVWEKNIVTTSSVCATVNGYDIFLTGCRIQVALLNGSNLINALVELAYNYSGGAYPHYRGYTFSKTPCQAIPQSVPFAAVGVTSTKSLGPVLYDPPICSMAFDITAVNP